jgi:hypothetical protein
MSGTDFDRPDWSSTSATMKSIAAGGARLARALLLGLEKTPAKLGKKGLELLDIHNLWTTALILVFWLAASVIGGPLGVAVNGVLIALALAAIPALAVELGTEIRDGLVLSWTATSDEELGLAGAYFAEAFSTIGVEAFQLFVTHRVFVTLKPTLLKRFKVPVSLETEAKAARTRIEAKFKEAAEKERKGKLGELVKTAAELTAAGGVKPAAAYVPTAEIALGAVATVGVIATVIVLSRGKK